MFDFSISNDFQATNSGSRRLAPWQIVNVKFAGASIVKIEGKKDPSKVYDILRVRFENEDGYFEESIFYPTEKDCERPVYDGKNGKYEAPSAFERTKTFIAQTASILNPKGYEKMQKASAKFRSFDDMAKAYVTIMKDVVGTETSLKLAGRTKQDGTVEAVLPKFVGVTHEGKLFTSGNFVGSKLFFTPYEEGQRAKFMNAAPTQMPSEPIDNVTTTSEIPADDSSDFDFESILN